MALLLRCLQDLRTLSGDSDLLPPPAGSEARGARSLPSHCDDPGGVSSCTELCEDCALPGGNAERAAQELARHAPLRFVANPSSFATSSTHALRR